ncbi:hypothetical protein BB560_006050, partial [Smittium megazygosporum]
MSEDHIPQAGSTKFSAQSTEFRLPGTMKFDGNTFAWLGELIIGNSVDAQLSLRQSFGKHLYTVDLPEHLEGVVKICAKVENRISELQATQYTGYSLSNYHHSIATNKYSQGQNINKDPDDMDVDFLKPRRGPISPEENERRRKLGLCYYCGEPGHMANDCKKQFQCLIDTGALKTIDFIPTALSHADVILGIPWLRKHSPAIDFEKRRIKFNSPYCVSNFLEKSTNLDAVFKVPDDENSDYGHTTDFDQNATNNNPESADTDSDTYKTAIEGEPDKNKIQIHHGNVSSNATLSKDPSKFETLKFTDTLLPREYTMFAPLFDKVKATELPPD